MAEAELTKGFSQLIKERSGSFLASRVYLDRNSPDRIQPKKKCQGGIDMH